jgi:hypothetical protein
MVASRLAGTLLAQALLLPAAWLIVWRPARSEARARDCVLPRRPAPHGAPALGREAVAAGFSTDRCWARRCPRSRRRRAGRRRRSTCRHRSSPRVRPQRCARGPWHDRGRRGWTGSGVSSSFPFAQPARDARLGLNRFSCGMLGPHRPRGGAPGCRTPSAGAATTLRACRSASGGTVRRPSSPKAPSRWSECNGKTHVHAADDGQARADARPAGAAVRGRQPGAAVDAPGVAADDGEGRGRKSHLRFLSRNRPGTRGGAEPPHSRDGLDAPPPRRRDVSQAVDAGTRPHRAEARNAGRGSRQTRRCAGRHRRCAGDLLEDAAAGRRDPVGKGGSAPAAGDGRALDWKSHGQVFLCWFIVARGPLPARGLQGLQICVQRLWQAERRCPLKRSQPSWQLAQSCCDRPGLNRTGLVELQRGTGSDCGGSRSRLRRSFVFLRLVLAAIVTPSGSSCEPCRW